MHPALSSLHVLREHAGEPDTRGIPDAILAELLPALPDLSLAIDRATAAHADLLQSDPARATMAETELVAELQEHVLNFYPVEGRSPFVPLAAAGPWIVTTHGAVLHDSAGYGMLGLGHAPRNLLDALAHPWPMANVMTPTLAQRALTDALRAEVGHTRADGCPYTRFGFLNSGSESVSLASRIVDIHARRCTDPGGVAEGKHPRFVSLREGFHGRTYRAATLSESTRAVYLAHLAAFSAGIDVDFVELNEPDTLDAAFAQAMADGAFIAGLFLEPVMGEGPAGLAMSPAFYARARALATEHHTLLLVDSIQAGLRAHGVLSIVDYPGFSELPPPDLETWSKALNAGQFPLSVLGLSETAAATYQVGVYGNTMTGNPRGMAVGAAVLAALTPEVRANVAARGDQLREGLEALDDDHPGLVTAVHGTGLMVSAELDPQQIAVTGSHGLEQQCRRAGIVLIHAGHNAVRFTPPLGITEVEVDLILAVLRDEIAALLG